MLKGALVFAGIFIVLLAPGALAQLASPSIEFIPDTVSVESSFIMIAEPGTGAERVSWLIPDPVAMYGSIPKVGEKWFCYFSNSDTGANCGPAPFTESSLTAGTYEILINSNGADDSADQSTEQLYVGGIVVASQAEVLSNGTVFLTVLQPESSTISSMTYSVYNGTLERVKAVTPLTKLPGRPWEAELELEPGEYYIAFKADGQTGLEDDTGGGIQRIVIPGATGTCASKSYTIETEKVSLGVLLTGNRNQTQTGFTIKNTGSVPLTELSYEIPDAVSRYVNITKAPTELDEGEESTFAVEIMGITRGMDINASVMILSDESILGEIELDIKASVIGDTGDACPAQKGDLSVSPSSWAGEFEAGDTATKTITITNSGEEVVTGLSYTSSQAIEGELDVSLPEAITIGGTGTATLEMSPLISGKYSGIVTISSDSGSANIVVNLEFYSPISSSISSAESELEDLQATMTFDQSSAFSTLIADIEAALDDAQYEASNGNIVAARQSYLEADAKIQALTLAVTAGYTPPTSPEPIPPGDGIGTGPAFDLMQTAIYGFAVVIVLLVVFLVYRKLKGRRSKAQKNFEEEQEELLDIPDDEEEEF